MSLTPEDKKQKDRARKRKIAELGANPSPKAQQKAARLKHKQAALDAAARKKAKKAANKRAAKQAHRAKVKAAQEQAKLAAKQARRAARKAAQAAELAEQHGTASAPRTSAES